MIYEVVYARKSYKKEQLASLREIPYFWPVVSVYYSRIKTGLGGIQFSSRAFAMPPRISATVKRQLIER